MQGLIEVESAFEQMARLESSGDKGVAAQTISMEGIPYADTFKIETRMVVSRHANHSNKVRVQIGVYLDFSKAHLLCGKIRSNLLEKMSVAQNKLVDSMEEVIGKLPRVECLDEKYDDDDDEESYDQEEEGRAIQEKVALLKQLPCNYLQLLSSWLVWLFPSPKHVTAMIGLVVLVVLACSGTTVKFHVKPLSFTCRSHREIT